MAAARMPLGKLNIVKASGVLIIPVAWTAYFQELAKASKSRSVCVRPCDLCTA